MIIRRGWCDRGEGQLESQVYITHYCDSVTAAVSGRLLETLYKIIEDN